MKAKIEEVAKATRRLPKIEDSLRKAQEQFEESSNIVAQLESELNDLGDIDHLDKEKKNIQEKMRANKEKLSAIRVRCHLPLILDSSILNRFLSCRTTRRA